jgi:hypothetical protein
VEGKASPRVGEHEGGRKGKLLQLECLEEIRPSTQGHGGVNRGRRSKTVGATGQRKGSTLRAGGLGACRALGKFPGGPQPDIGAGLHSSSGPSPAYQSKGNSNYSLFSPIIKPIQTCKI